MLRPAMMKNHYYTQVVLAAAQLNNPVQSTQHEITLYSVPGFRPVITTFCSESKVDPNVVNARLPASAYSTYVPF